MENEIKVGDKVIHLREEKTVEWIRGNDFSLRDKKGAMWITSRSCCKKKNDDEYDTSVETKYEYTISRNLWECEFGCQPEICRRPYGHCGRQI